MKRLIIVLFFLFSISLASAISVNNLELADLGFNGFVVEANLDVAGSSQVLYGKTGALGSATSLSSSSNEHLLQVDGLESGTVYFYRVVGKDSSGNSYSSAISLTRTAGSSQPIPTNTEFYLTPLIDDITIETLSNNNVVRTSNSDLTIGVRAPSNTKSVIFFVNGEELNVENGLPYTTPLFNEWATSGTKKITTQFYSGASGSGSSLGGASIVLELDTSGQTTIPPVTQPPIDTTPTNNLLVDTSELKAFPSAEGHGRYASGGRGGRIVYVTNLNCKGSGSLHDALAQSGARTIIFRVGGTIVCPPGDQMSIPYGRGDVTVAGESAPGDGIQISGSEFLVSANNVIVRHIRSRQINSGGSTRDSMAIRGNPGRRISNIIFDHVSAYWGPDESFNNRYLDDFTLQNSIVAESGKGVLQQYSQRTSFIKNLLAKNSERNVRANYGQDGGVNNDLNFEMYNNLVYAWKAATIPSYGMKVNVVGNKYAKSSYIDSRSSYGVGFTSSGEFNRADSYAYVKDNVMDPGISEYSSSVTPYLKSRPLNPSDYVVKDIDSVENDILASVGARPDKRDAVDKRIIQEYKDRDARAARSGNAPSITGGTPYPDTDKDGIADSWEFNVGGVVGRADNNGDHDGDGYTNVEEYLHFLAGEGHS